MRKTATLRRARRPPRRPPGPRRCLVTVDLGEEALQLLDACCSWMQQTQFSSQKVTRSYALREAVQCLYDRINAANTRKSEVTPT